MKNRKIAIVAFFLVAVLCIGAGYAAVTDLLDIQGTAEVSQQGAQSAFDENLYFSNAVANQTGNTATVNPQNNDKASFSANSLKTKDETVTFTFTIANDNTDLDASVKPVLSSETNKDYFEITSSWNGQTNVIPAGQTKDYIVTVKLLKQPADVVGAAFGIEFTATAVEKTVTP